MDIRFPRLMALAHRMVPGVFEDPQKIIGACRYCDADVAYDDGDHDAAGRARHDACERTVTRRQLDRVRADMFFMNVLGIVRDLPAVQPHASAAMRAMPEKFGPREMATFIDDMMPHVALEPLLTLRARRDTVVALRGAKRTLLGLDLEANETRPH